MIRNSDTSFNKTDHHMLYFNQNLVKSSSTHNNLGILLDTKLSFSLLLKNVQNKVNRTIRHLCKLQEILPRTSLIAIFKSFTRPHLDHGDIIYEQAYNISFISSQYQINSVKCCTGNQGCNTPSMKPTMMPWGGLPNKKISTRSSTRRACQSHATTFR